MQGDGAGREGSPQKSAEPGLLQARLTVRGKIGSLVTAVGQAVGPSESQWPPLGKHNDTNRAPAEHHGLGQAEPETLDTSAQCNWYQTTHGLPEHVKSSHLLVQALHCSVLQNAEILNCSKTRWEQGLHRSTTEILLRMLCYPRLPRKN